MLARVIEPTSKLDSIRVLAELGIAAPSYPTIKRRLPEYATAAWRQQLAGACAAHVGLGPATLVLYDCSTLYFEIDEGDGFREPGFSKERRLEPRITVGLLTDLRGFPLQVHAFDGNTAETKTIIPVLTGFAAAYGLSGGPRDLGIPPAATDPNARGAPRGQNYSGKGDQGYSGKAGAQKAPPTAKSNGPS